jgi:hypothetical protein
MRAELALAQRFALVRRAARDWRRDGAIDAACVAEVKARCPDTRVRRGPVARVVFFIFVSIVVLALVSFVAISIEPSDRTLKWLFLVAGLALAAATELQQGRMRFDGCGSEAATSFFALVFVVSSEAGFIGISWNSSGHLAAFLLVAAFLCAAAAWRWGYPLYALAAAGCLFGAIACGKENTRAIWVVAALGLLAITARYWDNERLPVHARTSLECLAAATLCALYAAGNRYLFDHGFLRGRTFADAAVTGQEVAGIGKLLSSAATGAIPVAVLAWGLLRRRRLLIDLGLAFSALSLVTLRFYVHLGPLWLVLGGSGAAVLVLAIGADRLLHASPGRERFGLTAEPLFEDQQKLNLLKAAAVIGTLSPDNAPAKELGPEFKGGGGQYGGGWASGEF